MAKKRGGVSPLGNTVGSQEAQQNAAKANIDSLTRQLNAELTKTGQDNLDYLRQHFGVNAIGSSFVWQLASGNTAKFEEITLTYEQVVDKTFVNFDINGRDQSLLTEESLQDLSSLSFQQFYPAVGHEAHGKIDILDGSRRRAWFLLQQGKIKEFRILVTQEQLEPSDAKALAKQLQTAKEHNLREIGKQCLTMQTAHEGITQAEIAKKMGLSQAGVSKAMKAASIADELIQLFPIANALSHPDYTLLAKVMKTCELEQDLAEFIASIRAEFVNIQAEYDSQDQKDAIISVIKAHLKLTIDTKKRNESQIINLANFTTKGLFARKKVKGRNFSYEFGRLSKEIQSELDQAIENVLKKHISN